MGDCRVIAEREQRKREEREERERLERMARRHVLASLRRDEKMSATARWRRIQKATRPFDWIAVCGTSR